MDIQATCVGMAQGSPLAPSIIVIFGVSGDLARTMLVPSLFALKRGGLLPERFAIIGFARRPWDDDAFRKEMQRFVKDADPAEWAAFARSLYYVNGDFTDASAESFAPLRERIHKLRRDLDLGNNVLFHLSTPPQYYGEIAHKLDAGNLLHSQHGWRRLIIEKPFGQDEASARVLDRQLLQVTDEQSIYRIDHFLGKETVQNMLVFRFANPSFEPIWNQHYIDHVQITAAETDGVGTRAGFYDKAGAVRDMIQNHLLQLLCITAMEPPVAYNATSLRDETAKVLKSIRLPDPAKDWVLGQYGRGRTGDREAAAYREEENVPRDSRTPTFAAVRLHVDNWRWAGVPFYLRSGKRLPRKLTTICIHFKPTPHLMFAVEPGHLQPNVLTFRLQPEEGIVQTFLAKQPGPSICLQPVTMTFRYDAAFGIKSPPSAYQWLLHDAMKGDQTLFARSDWIYQAWSLVDPAIRFWDKKAELPTYVAGSWGPEPAEALLRQDGRSWQCIR